MTSKKGKITRRSEYFTRDLGWKKIDGDKVVQHRFYFSKEMDLKAAERANMLLEQLWDQVVDDTHMQHKSPGEFDEPVQPLWDTQALWIAKAIAQGKHHLEVPYYSGFPKTKEETQERVHPAVEPDAYANEMHYLKQKYPFIVFVPADPNALIQGQGGHQQYAESFARKAKTAAAIANAPIPLSLGSTLYEALDAFCVHVKETRQREGKPTDWNKVLTESVRRLKRCIENVPVEKIDSNTVEAMVRFWTKRPLGERTGKPIAIESVRAQIKALKLFLKWLHKNPTYKWRGYTDIEDALRVQYTNLMTNDEIAGLKDGVDTFAPEDLTTLYKYATDRERVLILLGLNCAFARAECISLRKDEVHLDRTPPYIHRIRRKSLVVGLFALWPQTVQALKWNQAHQKQSDKPENPYILITHAGNQLNAGGIANVWNGLIKRVKKDHAKFRGLSFKYLRKTASQLVRNMSDGETASIFLSHGTPVKNDDLLSVYTNPNFSKVTTTLERVHIQLAPMFAASPDAFTNTRSLTDANISRATIDAILRLHFEGKTVSEISRQLKISRPTVYRWLPPGAKSH